MSSASAQPSNSGLNKEFITNANLVSMYKSIIFVNHQDYRVVSTTLHLIIEICLKKLALCYGLTVSRSSNSLNNLLFELQSKDAVVSNIFKELRRTGELRHLQRFPYKDLRFYEGIEFPKIRLSTMAKVSQTLLSHLEYMEGKMRKGAS